MNSSPQNRPLLALETSGNSLGVALHTDSGVVFEENVTEGMIHGRALVPLMKMALDAHGLKPADLAAVAVSQGPGSWTGLRIGIAAAKTFAWAAGIPVVSVPSFEALALEAKDLAANAGAVMTLRDARSEGFFAAIFDVTSGLPGRLLDECVLHVADVIEAAKRIHAKSLSVCGDEKCLALLEAGMTENGWTPLRELKHIPARAVAKCGWRRLQNDAGIARTAAEIHAFGPLYLRASDPELKLKKLAPNTDH